MSHNRTNAETSTITRDMKDFDQETGNVYESISIICKRANQISAELKEEINGKLADFVSTTDNLDEIFENREQIEISKYYEKMPKATLIAISEFQADEVYFKNPSKEV
ncbi:MAG: DNA-directed RNA polymerase subunit omega [Bacteroidia bacterium]